MQERLSIKKKLLVGDVTEISEEERRRGASPLCRLWLAETTFEGGAGGRHLYVTGGWEHARWLLTSTPWLYERRNPLHGQRVWQLFKNQFVGEKELGETLISSPLCTLCAGCSSGFSCYLSSLSSNNTNHRDEPTDETLAEKGSVAPSSLSSGRWVQNVPFLIPWHSLQHTCGYLGSSTFQKPLLCGCNSLTLRRRSSRSSNWIIKEERCKCFLLSVTVITQHKAQLVIFNLLHFLPLLNVLARQVTVGIKTHFTLLLVVFYVVEARCLKV